MRIVDGGVVAKGHLGTARASNAFSNILALPDGKLLITFQRDCAKDTATGNVFVSRSTDEGKTWSEPVAPFDGTLDGIAGSLKIMNISALGANRLMAVLMWIDRTDPKAPLFNPVTEGLLPVRNILAESRDDGESWTALGVADTAPFAQAGTTGAVRRVTDGVLAAFYETNKTYEDTSAWHHQAVAKFSYDEGKTWPDHAVVAADPTGRVFYCDQRNTVLRDNVLLTMLWTFDREKEADLPIHCTRSDDGGRTWREPADTGIVGQVACPVALGDGRVFISYVDRFDTRSIRACLSDDEGASWEAAPEIVLWEREPGGDSDRHGDGMADYLQSMLEWSFGLPSCTVAPNGDVFVTYYAGTPKTQSVYWARVKV